MVKRELKGNINMLLNALIAHEYDILTTPFSIYQIISLYLKKLKRMVFKILNIRHHTSHRWPTSIEESYYSKDPKSRDIQLSICVKCSLHVSYTLIDLTISTLPPLVTYTVTNVI